MANPLVVHVTGRSFDETVMTNPALVVDFWAPWCGPCVAIAPVLDALAGEYEGRATVAKVNVDEEPGLAGRFGVRSIPTLLFFKDGQVVDQVVGAAPAAELKKRLDAIAV